MIQSSRRSFITGMVSLVAAPAIVRAGSLMPVKSLPLEPLQIDFIENLIRPPFGLSPCMEAIIEFQKLNERIARAFHVPPQYLRGNA